jgi:outer membrane protein insertion porin family
MAQRSVLVVAALLLLCRSSFALTVNDLDPEVTWHTDAIRITGNHDLTTSQIRAQLVTQTRLWYAPWRERPEFTPSTFTTDIERIQRLYVAHGYYEAVVTYDLQVDTQRTTVTAHISIDEGKPVYVTQVGVAVTDEPAMQDELEKLRFSLPLQEGQVFREDLYEQSEAQLKTYFLDRHQGRVEVKRTAQVSVPEHAVTVQYTITAGPPTVFGQTSIEGTTAVNPMLIRRELRYEPGEPFSARAIERTRKKLLELDLFSGVRFLQDNSAPQSPIIPMRIQVDEKPFREWRLGAGYGTEDELRGQARWRHNNLFGDGRRLDVQVKASSLTRLLDVNYIHPYIFGTRNRFSLTFRPAQLDEPGYFLNYTRLQPRVEREFSDTLTGYLAYRLEYDQLNNIDAATIRRLQAFERKGVLSGLSLGMLSNTTDDPLNPTTGHLMSFSAEQVGGFLSGDFHFGKLVGDMKYYHALNKKLILATRLRVGFAVPRGKGKEVPLFERFFAGGANSVRGYGRHRLGPLSSADDPVGGRSLLEGSIELRRELFAQIGGIVFMDFGQVSLRSFDVPIEDLQFAFGVGASYATPVGPLRLDLGFPVSPPSGDQPWQVHFSIGQFF